MKQILKMNLYFDFYGKLLTENQQEVFRLYYHEDFSLSEIGDSLGITKQGASDLLKRAENKLEECEKKLGLANRFHLNNLRIKKIKQIISEIKASGIADNQNIDIAIELLNELTLDSEVIE